MTVTRRAAAFVLVAGLVAATGVAALSTAVATAAPQAPSSFHGFVTLDGSLPPKDAEVRALVDGVDCTQAPTGSPNVVYEGQSATYVLDVVHEDQRPGCGREGAAITFTVDGHEAAPSATWKFGLQRLDLDASSATPRVEVAGSVSELQSSTGDSSGFPALALALVALAVVGFGAIAAGWRLRRRPAPEPSSPAAPGDPNSHP
jgi:hypothetical protein